MKLAYDNDDVDVTELLSKTFVLEIMREFLWMNKGDSHDPELALSLSLPES